MNRYGSITLENELAPGEWWSRREVFPGREITRTCQLSGGPEWLFKPLRVNEAQRIYEVRVSPDFAVTKSSISLPIVHRESIYTPLEEVKRQFRVLILKEGSWGDPIICKLTIQSLDDNLDNYVAISYTWNEPVAAAAPQTSQEDPEFRYFIKVNHEKHFPIGANLQHALHHLRHPTEPKTIWIDAICIDQHNIRERGHQVQIMMDIYSGAHAVISWLGPSSHHSSSVMALVNQVHLEEDTSWKRELILDALRKSKFDFLQAYSSIFQRPYWKRTWIIQEIVSAKRLLIQCGSKVVPWKALVAFQKFLTAECYDEVWDPDREILVPPMDASHPWIQYGYITRPQLAKAVSDADRFTNLAVLRDLRKPSPSGEEEEHLRHQRTLDRLLFDNWDAIATDPLDKVFAIFRLASDGDQYEIQVDYNYDPDVRAVNHLYTSVVKKFIQLYGNLSIILPIRAQNPYHHLPSWVPDWSVSTPASRMGNWQDAYPFQVSSNSWDYFAAGYQSKAEVEFYQYNNSGTRQFMHAKGFRIDQIRHASNTTPDFKIEEIIPREHSNSILRTFLCFFPSDEETQTVTRKATDFEKWYEMHRSELWRGYSQETDVLRSISRDEKNAFFHYCARKHHEFFWILHRATHLVTDQQPRERRSENTRRLLQRWRDNGDIPRNHALRRRSNIMGKGLSDVVRDMGEVKINEIYTCFFTTKNGFMGLGPEALKERDHIVLLKGCGVPVILRRRGRSSFRVVGACYLAGFMYGEILTKRWAGTFAEETFEIC